MDVNILLWYEVMDMVMSFEELYRCFDGGMEVDGGMEEMYNVDCPYSGKCSDYGKVHKCKTCAHNKNARKSYYKPIKPKTWVSEIVQDSTDTGENFHSGNSWREEGK